MLYLDTAPRTAQELYVAVLSRTTTDALQRLHQRWEASREDLTVQQRVDSSAWHRRAIGGEVTACGKPIDHRVNMGLRHESYLGQLCREGCFSAFELEMSDRLNVAEVEREKKFQEDMEREFDALRDAREARERKKTNDEG